MSENERTLPEHKIKDIYARGGMVVVVGEVGGQEQVSEITRSNAIARAQAINMMIPNSKYASDARKLTKIVEMFMVAITKARENDKGKYTSMKVSAAMASMDPRSPLFVGR